MPAKQKSGGGRAGFLSASACAAFAENIKKEERRVVLHRLVEKQIELGRIVLPDEALADPAEAGGRAAAKAGAGAVEEAMEWLLAAHRGAGRSLPGSPAAAKQQQVGQPAAAQAGEQGEADTSCRSCGSSPRGSLVGTCCSTTPSEEEALLEQMRGISRSLWSTLSSGTASGAVAFPASRAAADFAWREDAVARMRAGGELDARHHRKRDAQTRHMEASARDAALRRGSTAPKAG
ncbi:hypothetical protein ABPG75_002315 [Micractinium tetrahymenae]